MAKELPYFKFNSTEWMTGEIVYEPLEVQGLFINICALYWKNLGVLEISQIEQRYKKKRLIDKLSGRFFSVSGGFISIAFLDEQLHEREALSEKNRMNGSLGGRPKETQKNPTVSENNPPLTQVKPKKSNIEEEREVDGTDRKKFSIPTNKMIYEYMIERGISESVANIQTPKFVDYYTSNGWRVGKNKMRDWKASTRNWIGNMATFNNGSTKRDIDKSNSPLHQGLMGN